MASLSCLRSTELQSEARWAFKGDIAAVEARSWLALDAVPIAPLISAVSSVCVSSGAVA
jgi:hypothetical protein